MIWSIWCPYVLVQSNPGVWCAARAMLGGRHPWRLVPHSYVSRCRMRTQYEFGWGRTTKCGVTTKKTFCKQCCSAMPRCTREVRDIRINVCLFCLFPRAEDAGLKQTEVKILPWETRIEKLAILSPVSRNYRRQATICHRPFDAMSRSFASLFVS